MFRGRWLPDAVAADIQLRRVELERILADPTPLIDEVTVPVALRHAPAEPAKADEKHATVIARPATGAKRAFMPLLVALGAIAIVAFVTLLAQLGAAQQSSNSADLTASAQPPPAPSAAASASTRPRPAVVGVVSISSKVTDSRAPEVAAVFDRYFSSINHRHYPDAISVFDPRGDVNPNDPKEVAAFSRSVSTSTDSDVVLLAVGTDRAGPGSVRAQVSFTSHQKAKFGPKGREGETCTRWNIRYLLTKTIDRYRILHASVITSRAC
jgi:hypothetical protein